jgi:PAT family beta-lactamase induction signal transducer AmpG
VKAFLQKKSIWGMLIFVGLYRTGEGFLLVEAPLFMQASGGDGGLGLTLEGRRRFDRRDGEHDRQPLAGILGGAFVAKFGLKRTLVFLAVCLNVPHLCYVFLSQAVSPGTPALDALIQILVCIEKFGYSFGFVGNMLYMMQQIAPGKYKMVHYAFATALDEPRALADADVQRPSSPTGSATGTSSWIEGIRDDLGDACPRTPAFRPCRPDTLPTA